MIDFVGVFSVRLFVPYSKNISSLQLGSDLNIFTGFESMNLLILHAFNYSVGERGNFASKFRKVARTLNLPVKIAATAAYSKVLFCFQLSSCISKDSDI